MKSLRLTILIILTTFNSFSQKSKCSCKEYVLIGKETNYNGQKQYVKIDSLPTLCEDLRKFKKENRKVKYSKSIIGLWGYQFYAGHKNYEITGSQAINSISEVTYYYVNINYRNDSISRSILEYDYPINPILLPTIFEKDSIRNTYSKIIYDYFIDTTLIIDTNKSNKIKREFLELKSVLKDEGGEFKYEAKSISYDIFNWDTIENYEVLFIESSYTQIQIEDLHNNEYSYTLMKNSEPKSISNYYDGNHNINLSFWTYGKTYAILRLNFTIPRATSAGNSAQKTYYLKIIN